MNKAWLNKLVIKSNVLEYNDKILLHKVNLFLLNLYNDTQEKLLELNHIYDFNHNYNIEFFYDVKNDRLKLTKLGADDVTSARIYFLLFEKYNLSAIQMTA